MARKRLNTEEINTLGTGQVILREAIAGLLLGLILGVVTTIWGYWLQGDILVATAVDVLGVLIYFYIAWMILGLEWELSLFLYNETQLI